MTKERSTKIINFMNPWPGFFLLGHGHISHIVKLEYFLWNLLLYSGAWFRQTKCVVIMTKKGSTKIVNFMIPREGVHVQGHGHISYIVKWHYFFKNLLLYFKAQPRQTDGLVMMSKEGSTNIINFMTPRAGILVLGVAI